MDERLRVTHEFHVVFDELQEFGYVLCTTCSTSLAGRQECVLMQDSWWCFRE